MGQRDLRGLKKKNGLRIMDEETKRLLKDNQILMAKLAVRQCQYKIAVEGLHTIVESNDPMNIAEKTLSAMDECIP